MRSWLTVCCPNEKGKRKHFWSDYPPMCKTEKKDRSICPTEKLFRRHMNDKEMKENGITYCSDCKVSLGIIPEAIY